MALSNLKIWKSAARFFGMAGVSAALSGCAGSIPETFANLTLPNDPLVDACVMPVGSRFQTSYTYQSGTRVDATLYGDTGGEFQVFINKEVIHVMMGGGGMQIDMPALPATPQGDHHGLPVPQDELRDQVTDYTAKTYQLAQYYLSNGYRYSHPCAPTSRARGNIVHPHIQRSTVPPIYPNPYGS